MSQPPGGSPPLWQGQPPQRPQQPEQPEPSSAGAPQQPQQAQQTPVPEQPEQQLVDALGEAADGGDRVIRTDRGKAHGLDKCPKCGSSEIHYQVAAGALVCEYCRFQWNEENAEKAFGLDSPIEQLRGDNVASGALNIEAGKSLVTLKCQGCGAEVVIKTDDTLQARCHWCRQTLSVNHQIPSGAVPDALLPFTLPREQAVTRIQEFVGARRTFANRTFLKEFTPENVNGVYVPYMVVDGNLHTEMHGSGEITTRRWTERRKVGDDNYVTETFYSTRWVARSTSWSMTSPPGPHASTT
jgi:ribosomal protein S27E